MAERYLTIPEVAERLVTTERFPRRLIEERRIEFVRLGQHVRIAESVLAAYVGRCTVAQNSSSCTCHISSIRRVTPMTRPDGADVTAGRPDAGSDETQIEPGPASLRRHPIVLRSPGAATT